MSDATVDDVLAWLDQIVERAYEARDRAGYFAVLYRTVTARVKDGLEADTFDDPDRMARLDVLFAQRYVDAERQWRAGEPTTSSWQLAFGAGSRWRPLALQHLLVGINAHINLDLGIAAAQCAPGSELAALQDDYDRINEILAAAYVQVEANLRTISPWIGLVDRLGPSTGAMLARFSLVTARSGAWRFATELASLPEAAREATIAERDRTVARLGSAILQPSRRAILPLLLVRLREHSDVRANLDALAAVPPPPLPPGSS